MNAARGLIVFALVWIAPWHAAAQSLPTVAVLAPTSGPDEAVGRRIVRDVMMAAVPIGAAEVEIFDTGADPAAAYRAAVEAGAIAIIGPATAREAQAAIDAREPGDPPLLVLTSVHGIEDADAGVFRMRTSPLDQARALAGWITAEGQWSTVAVFAPDDSYGDEAVEGFVRTTARYGGTVDRVVRYETGEPDVSAAAALLVGDRSHRLDVPIDPWSTPPEVETRSQRGLRTRPDAVFLPDYGDQIAAVLSHLAFHGWLRGPEGDVALLGISGWNAGGLDWAADLAAGAHVTLVFHPDDHRSAAEAFALEYRVRFGEDPTELDAQVFDAAAFLLGTLAAVGGRTPSLGDALRDVLRYSGACGDMWLAPGGGVVRDLGLWEVDGGGSLFPVGVIEPPHDPAER